jgi:hypothetical protein
MLARSSSRALQTLVPLFSVALALSSLACSGESSGDGDEGDDDDSGGSSMGGTSSGGSGGSGGSSGSATGGMPAYCDAAFMPTDPTAIIDDMEDGNALVRPIGDRNGGWWVTSDGSAGTIEPPSDMAPTPEVIPGKRCDSEHAIRMTGQGFTEWGAVLSLGFRYTTENETIDASTFTGVMFWARTGETHNSPVRVQFQDVNTRPEGGVCDPDTGSAEECYNGWGTELAPLSTEWRLYKLDFSRMTQRDFGYRADAFETAAVYNIEWNVATNAVFDLWIDDVWFYE